jgi:hypothetical protein
MSTRGAVFLGRRARMGYRLAHENDDLHYLLHYYLLRNQAGRSSYSISLCKLLSPPEERICAYEGRP